jgi:hypothetical protein
MDGGYFFRIRIWSNSHMAIGFFRITASTYRISIRVETIDMSPACWYGRKEGWWELEPGIQVFLRFKLSQAKIYGLEFE